MRTSARRDQRGGRLLDLAGAQEADQPRLQIEAQVLGVLEEETAAVGEHDLALAPQRPFTTGHLGPEQIGLDLPLLRAAAVDDDERPFAARAREVERARQQLAPGARLAAEEDVDLGIGDRAQRLHHLVHHPRLAHHQPGRQHHVAAQAGAREDRLVAADVMDQSLDQEIGERLERRRHRPLAGPEERQRADHACRSGPSR